MSRQDWRGMIFNPELERENWDAQSAAPPGREEMDALELDLRLWAPGSPGIFQDKRILDLGAGRAPFGVLATQRFAPALVVSTDLGYYRLHAAAGFNRELPALNLVCGDVFRLPFADSSFDCIAFNSFLHHLPELDAAVKEFTRVLRPGGYYFGREPNFNNPIVRAYIFGVRGIRGRRSGISANEYPLRTRQIRRAFELAGCVCDLKYFWRRWARLRNPFLSIAVTGSSPKPGEIMTAGSSSSQAGACRRLRQSPARSPGEAAMKVPASRPRPGHNRSH